MAAKITSKMALAWYAARERYQQLDLDVRLATSKTPLDDLESLEMEREKAQSDFLRMSAPTLEGLCERIVLSWGDILFDEEDDDMDMLRRIVGNIRQLANEPHTKRPSAR